MGIALPMSAFGAQISEITAEEFYAATYYHQAQEHPEIQKISSKAKRIQKVAKDIGMKPKSVEKALAKVEGLGSDPAELAKRAIETDLAKTKVQGRVKSVMINAEEPKHVVAYICWEGSASKNSLKEAAYIASSVGSGTPLVSTLSLNEVRPGADCKSGPSSVWSAKIGHEGMARINPKRIDDYAEKLYRNLFEGVTEKPF